MLIPRPQQAFNVGGKLKLTLHVMKKNYFILLTLILIGCKKNFDNTNNISELKLPAYSETGAQTFGFLLNDSVWTNFGKYFYTDGVTSGWRDNEVISEYTYAGTSNDVAFQVSGRLTIVDNNIATKDISAGLSFVPDLPYEKIYSLTGDYPRNFNVNDNISYKFYRIKQGTTFTLNVTKFDTLEKVCSGRLNGVLYNDQNGNDSIIVKDGRFDAKIP
jgi:hypothetical protein